MEKTMKKIITKMLVIAMVAGTSISVMAGCSMFTKNEDEAMDDVSSEIVVSSEIEVDNKEEDEVVSDVTSDVTSNSVQSNTVTTKNQNTSTTTTTKKAGTTTTSSKVQTDVVQ